MVGCRDDHVAFKKITSTKFEGRDIKDVMQEINQKVSMERRNRLINFFKEKQQYDFNKKIKSGFWLDGW